MAKKKKVEEDLEEDWFEDDDWEEEKPKKKKANKGKKKNYAWVWVVAFIVILAILLLIRYKFATPADNASDEITDNTEAPAVEEDRVYIPESERETDTDKEGYESSGNSYEEPRDIGEDVVTDPEMQTGKYKQESLLGEPTNEDPEQARDLTDEPELFSNIECNYDYETGVPYISLRVYNTLDEDILISPKGVAKGYNTYFMIRGIVDADPGCGTEVLPPGQYTECTKIGFDGKKYGNIAGINRISVQVPKRTEALLVNCPEDPEDDYGKDVDEFNQPI